MTAAVQKAMIRLKRMANRASLVVSAAMNFPRPPCRAWMKTDASGSNRRGSMTRARNPAGRSGEIFLRYAAMEFMDGSP